MTTLRGPSAFAAWTASLTWQHFSLNSVYICYSGPLSILWTWDFLSQDFGTFNDSPLPTSLIIITSLLCFLLYIQILIAVQRHFPWFPKLATILCIGCLSLQFFCFKAFQRTSLKYIWLVMKYYLPGYNICSNHYCLLLPGQNFAHTKYLRGTNIWYLTYQVISHVAWATQSDPLLVSEHKQRNIKQSSVSYRCIYRGMV